MNSSRLKPGGNANGASANGGGEISDNGAALPGDESVGAFEARSTQLRVAEPQSFEMASGRNRYAEEEEQGLDLRRLAALLRRRRKLIFAAFVLVLGAGALLTWTAKPVYESTSQILVNTAPAAGGGQGSDISTITDLMSGQRPRSQETQIEILKSQPVTDGAMKRLPAARRDAADKFSKINVQPVRDTDVIAVSVQSHDPTVSAGLAQAICQEYIHQSLEHNRDEMRVATQYVGNQRADVSRKLNAAEKALKNFEQKTGVSDPVATVAAAINDLAKTNADLREARANQSSLQAQLSQLRQVATSLPKDEVSSSIVVANPALTDLYAQLTKLQIQLNEARQEYAPGSADVTSLESQVRQLEKRIAATPKTISGSTTTTGNPIRQDVLSQIAQIEGQLQAAGARVASLQVAANRLQAGQAAFPQQKLILSGLNRELATLQQTYQVLNEKYLTMRIGMEGRLANARIISAANVPEKPVSPNKPRNLILSTLLGLMLALALAALADRLDDRVHSEEDAEIASRLPVLAHIPFIQEKAKQSLINNTQQTSSLLESYRMLRTNIEFAAVGEPIRSIVITSSQPNEGKSTTSVDLAIVMALDGKKVILVDADLRRPSAHKLLGLSNKFGFTSVVAGTRELEDALQETTTPNLRVLTSGPTPPNPPEFLNSKAARALLREMRDMADIVIIDTPPGLVMADAQIAASVADAALLVISFREAGKREIARTSELLSQTGTKVLGSVLNKLTDEVSGYYGYYGYKNRYYGNYLDAEGNQEEDSKAIQSVR